MRKTQWKPSATLIRCKTNNKKTRRNKKRPHIHLFCTLFLPEESSTNVPADVLLLCRTDMGKISLSRQRIIKKKRKAPNVCQMLFIVVTLSGFEPE